MGLFGVGGFFERRLSDSTACEWVANVDAILASDIFAVKEVAEIAFDAGIYGNVIASADKRV